VAELGLEPSAQLADLLPADPDPPAPASAYADLPPDPPDFTGRRAEVGAVLGVASGAPATAVPIVTVEGMAGVGKSGLVVHAAHRLVAAGRYADVRLHVDLRGFSPGGEPADPGAVLETFLRLLGVPPDRIPADRQARAAVFRDRLAGRHALVLLDNALDREQVEPLLPASPTCLVLITSRRSLAIEGAHAVRLDPFTADEARDLLAAVLGAEAVAAEPAAAADLAVHCGHLPLAVAVAARRLRSARPGPEQGDRRERPIADLVARLAGDELAGAHQVFDLSYRALDPARRRVFRLLGVHPGSDCTAASVAAMADLDPAGAEETLEALLDDHLLQQVVPGRYRLHDLLRAFAARLSRTQDQRAAGTRLLDWYVHAAEAATTPMRRYRVGVRRDITPPTTPVPVVAGIPAALAWLDAEYANLMAVQRFAAAGGWPDHAVQLPLVLQPYFVRRSHIDGWVASLRLAEVAARRLDDPGARAYTLTDLGHAHSVAGRSGPAADVLAQALTQHRRHDDRYGEALTLGHLAWLRHRTGDYTGSLDSYRAALRGYEAVDEPHKQATTLNTMGVQLHLLGRHDEALDHLHRALRLHRRLGDRAGEASLRTNLSRMYGHLGRHRDAVGQAEQALALHRDAGSGPGQAYALVSLCVSYAHLGRHDEAIAAGRRAADLTGDATEVTATVRNGLGEAYGLAGRHREAAREHRAALDVARAIGYADEINRAERGIAAALIHQKPAP
jgi:tetratricopeptide (TPR) repeat protein